MARFYKEKRAQTPIVTQVQSLYGLCRSCLERQVGHSIEIDGKKSKQFLPEDSCYICQGLLESLPEFSLKAIDALKDYEFDTFSVGVSLDRDLYEREDEIRSKFKLRGGRTLRSEIAGKISAFIATKVKAQYVYRKADLTVLISLPRGFVTVLPRPIVIFGRYTKSERGIRQKRSVCENCSGLGCSTCNNTGETGKSIESMLGKELLSLFEGKKIRFTWVGGEDSDSLVLGRGRPFFAVLAEARKRKLRPDKRVIHLNGITAKIYRMLDSIPQPSPMFRTVALVRVLVRGFPHQLKRGVFVARRKFEVSSFSNKPHPVIRKVYSIKVDEVSDSRVSMKIAFEGGLSLKNFVSGGKGSTYPSLKDLLHTDLSIDEDHPFDILDVKLVSANVP
jgi:tRNA pseudouridine synthase 10